MFFFRKKKGNESEIHKKTNNPKTKFAGTNNETEHPGKIHSSDVSNRESESHKVDRGNDHKHIQNMHKQAIYKHKIEPPKLGVPQYMRIMELSKVSETPENHIKSPLNNKSHNVNDNREINCQDSDISEVSMKNPSHINNSSPNLKNIKSSYPKKTQKIYFNPQNDDLETDTDSNCPLNTSYFIDPNVSIEINDVVSRKRYEHESMKSPIETKKIHTFVKKKITFELKNQPMNIDKAKMHPDMLNFNSFSRNNSLSEVNEDISGRNVKTGQKYDISQKSIIDSSPTKNKIKETSCLNKTNLHKPENIMSHTPLNQMHSIESSSEYDNTISDSSSMDPSNSYDLINTNQSKKNFINKLDKSESSPLSKLEDFAELKKHHILDIKTHHNNSLEKNQSSIQSSSYSNNVDLSILSSISVKRNTKYFLPNAKQYPIQKHSNTNHLDSENSLSDDTSCISTNSNPILSDEMQSKVNRHCLTENYRNNGLESFDPLKSDQSILNYRKIQPNKALSILPSSINPNHNNHDPVPIQKALAITDRLQKTNSFLKELNTKKNNNTHFYKAINESNNSVGNTCLLDKCHRKMLFNRIKLSPIILRSSSISQFSEITSNIETILQNLTSRIDQIYNELIREKKKQCQNNATSFSLTDQNDFIHHEKKLFNVINELQNSIKSLRIMEENASNKNYHKDADRKMNALESYITPKNEVMQNGISYDNENTKVDLRLQFNMLEEKYTNKLQDFIRKIQTHDLKTNEMSGIINDTQNQVTQLSATVKHLLDVNQIAKECVEDMQNREDKWHSMIKKASNNENHYKSYLKKCVPLNKAKEFAFKALKKGIFIQYLLSISRQPFFKRSLQQVFTLLKNINIDLPQNVIDLSASGCESHDSESIQNKNEYISIIMKNEKLHNQVIALNQEVQNKNTEIEKMLDKSHQNIRYYLPQLDNILTHFLINELAKKVLCITRNAFFEVKRHAFLENLREKLHDDMKVFTTNNLCQTFSEILLVYMRNCIHKFYYHFFVHLKLLVYYRNQWESIKKKLCEKNYISERLLPYTTINKNGIDKIPLLDYFNGIDHSNQSTLWEMPYYQHRLANAVKQQYGAEFTAIKNFKRIFTPVQEMEKI